jgi:AraC family transcriptional regulator of adaptative response/methylated-DNA-[protein]-cysteine methyltransferase
VFYLAVRTTGVFCLPSCPARKPMAKNVEYFATTAEAMAAGYRPCKRCQPLNSNGHAPDWASQLIHAVEQNPTERITDTDLRARDLNPAQVRRYFLKHYGMTFHAYARANRLGQAFTAIREGVDLDDVALSYGYESHSGFREAFGQLFGEPPGRSRDSACVIVSWLESPLGPLIAGTTDMGVCLLEFSDRRGLETQIKTLQRRFKSAMVPGQHPHLSHLQAELQAYFAGHLTRFSVPLDYPGTPFQCRLWDALLEIPYGETRSYQQMGEQIGSANAQRAVGKANGDNRLAILIPCHRLAASDGNLRGYGGGLWRKRLLLSLEKGEHRFGEAIPETTHQMV